MTVKMNLGCGEDVRPGYVNVDFRKTHPAVLEVDLSRFPWPFADGHANEVLMLDFLEHFPYHQTSQILDEAWRILQIDGILEVQVPDFVQLSNAVKMRGAYHCNKCGNVLEPNDLTEECDECGVPIESIAKDAVRRLYGGQDYEGNLHKTAFTIPLLHSYLTSAGFDRFELLEKDHQRVNWNFKVRARKSGDLW